MARKRQSGRTRSNRLGSFCLILQALISIIFMIVVVLLDMLPGNYLALVAMILVERKGGLRERYTVWLWYVFWHLEHIILPRQTICFP